MKAAFFTVVGLQMAFLLGQTAMYQGRLARGETVYLKVVPYDPRSLFMGNYAVLRYDISLLPLDRFADAGRAKLERGDTVYVGLTSDRPAKLVRFSRRMPADRGGLVWLKARVNWVASDWRNGRSSFARVATVTYGLERFYVSERKGRQMNQLNRQLWDRNNPPQIVAVASVGSGGAAMLKEVLVNGKPVR
jgi:uncharacterized membrane-anchored protein